jgi:hypothetical protein
VPFETGDRLAGIVNEPNFLSDPSLYLHMVLNPQPIYKADHVRATRPGFGIAWQVTRRPSSAEVSRFYQSSAIANGRSARIQFSFRRIQHPDQSDVHDNSAGSGPAAHYRLERQCDSEQRKFEDCAAERPHQSGAVWARAW